MGDTNLGTKALELVAMNTFLPSLLSFLYWGFMKVFNTVIRNPVGGVRVSCVTIRVVPDWLLRGRVVWSQIYHCLKWRVVEAKPLMPEISGWYAAIIKTFALGMLFGPISPAGNVDSGAVALCVQCTGQRSDPPPRLFSCAIGAVYPLSVISFLILHAQVGTRDAPCCCVRGCGRLLTARVDAAQIVVLVV